VHYDFAIMVDIVTDQHPDNCMQTRLDLNVQRVTGFDLTMAHHTNRRELAQSNAKIKRFTLAIAVWCYSNGLFVYHFLSFSFVASKLQMNLSTL